MPAQLDMFPRVPGLPSGPGRYSIDTKGRILRAKDGSFVTCGAEVRIPSGRVVQFSHVAIAEAYATEWRRAGHTVEVIKL